MVNDGVDACVCAAPLREFTVQITGRIGLENEEPVLHVKSITHGNGMPLKYDFAGSRRDQILEDGNRYT